MKLPRSIRIKIGSKTALAIYPNVYLPKKVFENLKSKNPNPKYIAILAHEQKHIERQKEMGPFKWGIKYSFCSGFRFNEELAATKAQMEVHKKYGIKFDIEKNARYLSSWLYFWPVSYETAKKELEKI